MIKGIDHLEVVTRDVEAMAEFLKKLGFKEVRRTDHHGLAIEVRPPGENQPVFELHAVAESYNPGINHIAFTVDDCQATFEQLKAKGIVFQSEPELIQSSGRIVASFRDPDGFRIQLAQ